MTSSAEDRGPLVDVREVSRSFHGAGAVVLEQAPTGEPGGLNAPVLRSDGALELYESRAEFEASLGAWQAREAAGTPGMYQVLRAALALDVKAAVGVDAIRQREHELLERALARWAETDRVEVLGPTTVERLSIVSFNIALGDDAEGDVRAGAGRYLHPRFVTVLLDDLFGIQSRAGCSCAGPYGHRLLDIDDATSARYRQCLVDGVHGLKPGWARVGLHFTMSDAEADYVIDAVAFVAEHGAAFLSDYAFDVATGAWTHRRPAAPPAAYALARAVAARPSAHAAPDDAALASRIADALAHARALVHDRAAPDASGRLAGDLADLQFFALPA